MIAWHNDRLLTDRMPATIMLAGQRTYCSRLVGDSGTSDGRRFGKYGRRDILTWALWAWGTLCTASVFIWFLSTVYRFSQRVFACWYINTTSWPSCSNSSRCFVISVLLRTFQQCYLAGVSGLWTMIQYTADALLTMWRSDVTLPPDARKAISKYTLWPRRPARQRWRQGIPLSRGWSSHVLSRSTSTNRDQLFAVRMEERLVDLLLHVLQTIV